MPCLYCSTARFAEVEKYRFRHLFPMDEVPAEPRE